MLASRAWPLAPCHGPCLGLQDGARHGFRSHVFQRTPAVGGRGCRSGCPTAALPVGEGLGAPSSSVPAGGRHLLLVPPVGADWRLSSVEREKPRRHGCATAPMGGCWQSLGLRAAWCVMLIVAVLPSPALVQRDASCLLAVPSERVRIRAGALRALEPSQHHLRGLPSDHSLQVQSIECDELRCCEFVTKLPWEAEEHVGQRGGRGVTAGRAGGSQQHGSSGFACVHTEAPGHPSRRPDSGVREWEKASSRGFPGLRAPRRARCPAGVSGAGDVLGWCFRRGRPCVFHRV